MKLKILIAFLFIVLIGCKNKPNENIIDEEFCMEELEIIIDNKIILIENENNKGSVSTEKKIYEKLTVEKETFELTEEEKQKIFSNAYKLITLKNYLLKTKTCNAGQDFVLRLLCSSKALEFKVQSSDNWIEISNETKEIYTILKDKIDLE